MRPDKITVQDGMSAVLLTNITATTNKAFATIGQSRPWYDSIDFSGVTPGKKCGSIYLTIKRSLKRKMVSPHYGENPRLCVA